MAQDPCINGNRLQALNFIGPKWCRNLKVRSKAFCSSNTKNQPQMVSIRTFKNARQPNKVKV